MADEVVGLRISLREQARAVRGLREFREEIEATNEALERGAALQSETTDTGAAAAAQHEATATAAHDAAEAQDRASGAAEYVAQGFEGVVDAAGDLGEALWDVSDTTESWTNRMENLQEHMSTFGREASIWVSGPIAGLTASMKGLALSTEGAASQIEQSALEAGISTEAYQELEYAGSQLDLKTRDLDRGLSRLNQRVGRAIDGSDRYADAFDNLGVEITDASGAAREADEVFMDTVGSLAELESQADKSALAGEIFGTRMGRRLMPALDEGREGIEALRREAHELGIVLTDDTIDAASELGDATERISRAFQGAWHQIGAAFLPVVADELVPALENRLIPALQGGAELVSDMVGWFSELPEPIQNTTLAIGGTAAALGPLSLGIAQLMTWVGRLKPALLSLAAFMKGPWGLAIAAGAAVLFAFTQDARRAAEASTEYEQALMGVEGQLDATTDQAILRRLADEGLLEVGRELGLSQQELIDVVEGGEGAWERVTEQSADYEEATRGSADALHGTVPAHEELEAALRSESEAYLDVRRAMMEDEFARHGMLDMLYDLDDGLQDTVLSAGSFEDALRSLPPHLQPTEEAMAELLEETDDVTEALEEQRTELERLGDDAQVWAQHIDGMVDSNRAFRDASAEAAAQAQETAQAQVESGEIGEEAAREMVEEASASIDDYVDQLREQVEAQQEWEKNLVTIAETAGHGVAAHLAALGPEAADLVADAADGSADALSELEDLLPATARDAGENATGAMSDELDKMIAISSLAGEKTVDEMAEKLGVGADKIRDIARRYGIELEDAINPVLDTVSARTTQAAYSEHAEMRAFEGRNTGGPIGGDGPNEDSIAAMLTPGEYVWSRPAVQTIGAARLDEAHRRASHGDSRSAEELLFGGDESEPGMAFGYNVGGVVAAGQQWARGEAGKPYLWGGVGPVGYDCSGFMSALQNYLMGNNPHSRLYATGSFSPGRGAAGLAPGLGSAFSVGVVRGSPGHMSGTLGGMNVESRGSRGVVVGAAARGADDPLYNMRFHLPEVGGMFVPGGALAAIDLPEPPSDWPGDGLLGSGPFATEATYETVKDWLGTGVYDRGGALKPGWTLAYNGTGSDEQVRSEGSAPLPRDSRGPVSGGVTIQGDVVIHADDGDEMFERFRDRVEAEVARK